jgi:pilus assembly protein TadC
MTVAVLALLVATLCWPARPRPVTRIRPQSGPPERQPAPPRRPVVVLAVVAIVALVVVGGSRWLAALLAVGALMGSRARPADAPAPDEVSLTADLMAACLAAGAAVADALSAALVAAGPWLRTRGEPVVAGLRGGAPAAEAWSEWLGDERLAPVARTCVRTAGSGAAAAAELVRVAARMRAARRTQSQQRVARAAVWIVLPLGACFLPAFVAVGVVPLVISLLERMH